MLAATHAAARGDAGAALASYGRIARFAGNYQLTALEQLVELGEAVPSWAVARWMCAQALRQFTPASERSHVATLDALAEAGYLGAALRRLDTGTDAREALVYLLGTDWAYRQLRLFEGGALRQMLGRASPSLLERAGPVAQWCDVRLSGYRIASARPGQVRVRDLGTDEELDVLDIGTAAEAGEGGFVLGRLVPIDAAPGRLFESRPFLVDPETAEAVARRTGDDPGAWLAALTDAARVDRVDLVASWRTEWPLVSDVPSEVLGQALRVQGEPPITRWLDRQKVRAEVRDAVGMCDLVVRAQARGRLEGDQNAPMLSAALLTPGALEHVTRHVVAPDLAEAWRSLSELMHEPARTRGLLLAAACADQAPT